MARNFLPWVGEQLNAGRELTVTAHEIEDDRSLKQNSFYWGFVLRTISEQATVNGIGSHADGWNYVFKKQFLGYRVTKTKVPGSKRPVIRRELRSTKDLKVKPMSEFLEKVMAHAATVFGVTFEDKRWEDWRA